jgi:hypothetical protein
VTSTELRTRLINLLLPSMVVPADEDIDGLILEALRARLKLLKDTQVQADRLFYDMVAVDKKLGVADWLSSDRAGIVACSAAANRLKAIDSLLASEKERGEYKYHQPETAGSETKQKQFEHLVKAYSASERELAELRKVVVVLSGLLAKAYAEL